MKSLRFIAACLLLVPIARVLAADAGPPVRITLLGDSMTADQPASRPIQGWGTYLEARLKQAKVLNLARSGRSTKTYLHGHTGTNGEKVLPVDWTKAQVAPADYWLIKFGGNDSHPATEEKHTEPEEYAANLRHFVREARQRGIKPILVTSIRRPFGRSGHLTEELKPYAEAVRAVAKSEGTPLIDLYAFSTQWFEELGPQGIVRFLPADLGGHLNRDGAELVAGEVARALAVIEPRLKAKAAAVSP